MLDKQLCAILGIDEFTQWIMERLDLVEDELYAPDISNSRYLELKAVHSTLKEVRDKYCSMNSKKPDKETEEIKKKSTEETAEALTYTYKFEINVADFQVDSSRFLLLTHHFDYLCPLDLYPDVTICDVSVHISIYDSEHKVTVIGYANGKKERVLELLSEADLTGWGLASIIDTKIDEIK